MKLIDRTAIENWAGTYEAMEIFPTLISKLVHATSQTSANIKIPCGSAISLGGWDGIVTSEQNSYFIPSGTSLWEFGTNSAIKGKADEDYIKRTEDPLGHIPSECTYIFVTPRLWTKKDKWIEAKKREGVWKNILVYDAVDLSQWLENSSAVAIWFAVHLGNLPSDGVLDAEQFWLEWSVGPHCTILPQAVTSGRESQAEQLFNFLIGEPGIKGVKAKTKTEAVAFIVAAAKEFLEHHKNRFFSKTLLVELEGSYRSLSINNQRTPLNLIPKFEDKGILYNAVSKGHHVIVPLGGDDPFNQDIITLPTIEKDGQVQGLIDMGYSQVDAESYSKEAARDITILRRLLKFWDNKAAWFKNEKLRDIVPALLLGRWNIHNDGDRELIEKLSGMPFDNYMEIVMRWKDFEDSPLIQIGDTWRLASPLDLWANLSGFLTENDFNLLAESFLEVYQDISSAEEEDNDILVSVRFSFSAPKKYSGWAKEGLVQSLILISQYGTGLQLAKLQRPEFWVDTLIEKLLSDADGQQWTALDQKLPLISEASPKSFLKAVSNSLSLADPQIMDMFKSKAGFLGESSNHTGLLWALEGLAWLPEYLYDVTIILLKLAKLDPGGNLVNRPDNSLIEIYKPWHFQTLAPFEQRMEILRQAVINEETEGWKLLIKLLPKSHSIARPTHKMRWRLFEKNININHTHQEANQSYSVVVDLLLELYDNTDHKLAQLIENSITLTSSEDSEKILSFIENVYSKIPKDSTEAREQTRKILSHHRSYPTADWSLPENILERYQTLYEVLEPDDVVLKYQWLFDSSHVEFPDGKFQDDSEDESIYEKSLKRLEESRIEALKIILEHVGLQKTIELGNTFDSASSIGETLAKIPLTESDIIIVLQTLKKVKPNLALGHRFAQVKVAIDGLDWVFDIFQKLKKEGFTDEQLAQLFVTLDHSASLWDFIDQTTPIIKENYWHNVHPQFYRSTIEEKIRGLKYLLLYKRFISTINSAYMIKKDVPTQLLIEILERAATEESFEKYPLREYEVTSLFKTLEEREDLLKETLIKLEWMYLSILGSHSSGYKPKHLHQELAESPEFFIEILKWVYMPKDDKRKEEERKAVSPEALKTYATQGFKLLNDFKTIPGIQKDNSINAQQLNLWIDTVREMATLADRTEMADMHIGKVLAHYPETNKDYWPPDEISSIIERINTKSLKNNFSITITNKRGFTSRGPYDGGAIERANAKHFQKLADLHKHRHPNLSEIFIRISSGYLRDAKYEDDQAERDRLEY